MKILAIESSCDETAAAVIEDGRKIISNVIASSAAMHEVNGGIIPEIAARQQVASIIPVINEALTKLSLTNDIDALAITTGPGLIGSLLVGVETAKTLAYMSGKPIIPVNHVIAHLYANFLEIPHAGTVPMRGQSPLPEFPALGLVVSGGHTELFYMESPEKLKWIGGTLDDASGEAFDKCARIMDLGFPGGPAIAAQAAKFPTSLKLRGASKIKLPRPMIYDKSLNFSFSGLKTAVCREVKKFQPKADEPLAQNIVQELSHELQESITDVLVDKTLKAAAQHKVKSILLGGGVAANKRLTEKFNQSAKNILVSIPPPSLCTDNAAYIGSYAYFNNQPLDWKKISARPDLEVEVPLRPDFAG